MEVKRDYYLNRLILRKDNAENAKTALLWKINNSFRKIVAVKDAIIPCGRKDEYRDVKKVVSRGRIF